LRKNYHKKSLGITQNGFSRRNNINYIAIAEDLLTEGVFLAKNKIILSSPIKVKIMDFLINKASK